MQRAWSAGRRRSAGAIALGLLATAIGCGDLPLQLEVAEGSAVTIEVPGEAPVTVALRGMVRARAQLPLDLAAVAAGKDLVGMIRIEEVLLAGEPSTIAGVPTGVTCTSLAAESGGSLTVNALQGRVRIDAVVNNQTQFSEPRARELGTLVLANPLQAEVSADLGTLLGALNGAALPIDIVQRIDDISEGGGALDGTRVSGDIHFRSPAGDLSQIPGLETCRQLVAGS